MKRFCALFAISLLPLQPLAAEIVSTTLIWNAAQCDAKCSKRVETQLNRMSEVNRVDFDGEGGRAILYWRPGQTLRNAVFKRITTSNNITLQQVDLTVRGTVTKSGKRYFIKSLGDQSQIELLTLTKQPPEVEKAQQPYLYNKRYASTTKETSPLEEKNTTYSLSKRMAGKLDDVIKSSKIIAVNGTLVDPQNSTLQMIISEDSVLE